jgi:hypothetical protein
MNPRLGVRHAGVPRDRLEGRVPGGAGLGAVHHQPRRHARAGRREPGLYVRALRPHGAFRAVQCGLGRFRAAGPRSEPP